MPMDQQKPSQTLLEKMILSWVAYSIVKLSLRECGYFSRTKPSSLRLRQPHLRYLAPPHIIAHTPFEPIPFGGTALALAAIWFRLTAYSTMGKEFTFEISVQKDHKLITTFPYNIVRHPSYITQFFVWIGTFAALVSPDGWTRTFVWDYLVKNGGVAGALVAIVMGLVVLFYLGGFRMCVAGTAHEDGLLRETFRKDGDEWGKDVPHRLVPGVY